ncbi:MAG TPA: AAA family ATPase [Candidatus Limnocylindrales bacterium]|nr:AAA family ATPase [Candidatus Limnocylindrales bacterium]
MSTDPRLVADLELLRVALGAYLARLRALWAEPAAGRAEIERLLAAAGVELAPAEPERELAQMALQTASLNSGGPLARIVAALDLAPGEELLVASAWWSESDPQVAVLLGCAHDDGARRHPSAALIRLLLAPFEIDAPPALDDGHRLVRFGVLESGAEAREPVRLTPTARTLLSGGVPEPIATTEPPPERQAALLAGLVRHLRAGAPGAVVLRGPGGSGRRALAAAAARTVGLTPVAGERSAAELRLLGRLQLALPVVSGERLEELAWAADDPPLAAYAPGGFRASAAYVVDVRPPTHRERARAWRGELTGAGLDAQRAAALAGVIAARFAFTEGDIGEVVARARVAATWADRPLDRDLVWDVARRQPEHALERVAALIAPSFTLDDLVLADDAHAQLKELVTHVALQHVVLDDWGFRRRLPRGQGVAVLFAGPPGTGKTMAAEAIADALEQDLYRIDLSAVVSKYIGETEKNLASAFDEAERAGAVLFFDEADALFGKRTDVRDSHDRYANIEIDYLLQRMEEYTGLAILATNRKAALDRAFLRRLRFLVDFPFPAADLRLRIWQKVLPPSAPTQRIDFGALSRLDLSGGSIQSVALNAAFLAAADGRVIAMDHLAHAASREYAKLDKVPTEAEFGGLAEAVAS